MRKVMAGSGILLPYLCVTNDENQVHTRESVLVCSARPCTFSVLMSPLLRLVMVLLLALGGSALAVVPTISTPKVTAIAADSATLTAKINPNGSATTVTFSYGHGTTVTYTTTVSGTPALSAGDPETLVSATVTGLVSGDAYQFKVEATNGDGTATTRNQTFIQTTDSPTLMIDEVPTHTGADSTVHGTLTTAGVAGNLFFEFGATTAYGMTTAMTHVAANTTQAIDITLAPNATTYHYRLVFVADPPSTIDVRSPDDLNNQAPIAAADSAELTDIQPVTIDVLANDTDADDGQPSLTLLSITPPQHGTAVISGNSVRYTPNSTFQNGDKFTYTTRDPFNATATTTVTIRTLRSALSGTHGGFITKANGKENGYFTITTNARGGFTAYAIIEGKRYVLMGYLDIDGSFKGYANGDSGAIPVELTTINFSDHSIIHAVFNGGNYMADATVADTEFATRSDLRGRYTVGIAAGGEGPTNGNDPGTPPSGSGWCVLRVRDDGTAIIKGRLTEGRSFSTRGTVNILDGTATLNFFDRPEASDPESTRVVGAFTLGDSVGGTIRTDRDSWGFGRFPRGFDLTQSVDGAPYTKPPDYRRVLDTNIAKGQDLTIAFSEGDLPGTLTRQLFLDDDDHVTVVDRGAEELDMRIDRNTGRWWARFNIDTNGTRLKATGVLIQDAGGANGRGLGTFTTATDTGTATISPAGSGGTTATP